MATLKDWLPWAHRKNGEADKSGAASPYAAVASATNNEANGEWWIGEPQEWNTSSATWTSHATPEGYIIPKDIASRLKLPGRCFCGAEYCWSMDKNQRGSNNGRWFFVGEHLTPSGIVCPHREEDAHRNQFDMAAAQCEMLLDIF